MLYPRYIATTLCQGGKIYVLGGLDNGYRPTNACETLDTTTLKGSKIAPMQHERYDFAAVFFGEKIWVMGGLDTKLTGKILESPPLKSVEQYSVVENQWTTLSSKMNRGMYKHSACVLYNQIFILSRGNNKIEFYDQSLEKWAPYGCLTNNASGSLAFPI